MKVFEEVKTSNFIKKYILGIKIYEKEIFKGGSKEKYLYGFVKTQKTQFTRKINILGMKFSKKHSFNETALNNLHDTRKLLLESQVMQASVVELHEKTFSKYKNIYTEKDVVVVGTGPTLQYYQPIENAIHISLNRAFKSEICKFDYAFLSHYDEKSAAFIEDLLEYDCIKFFGKYVRDRSISMNIPFKYEKDGLERYYVDTLPIYPFPMDITKAPLKNGGSIAFAALQFALYTNPRRIYLVGLDTNMSGYIDKNIIQGVWTGLPECIPSYKKFKIFASALYPDTEIISINPVGLKGIFEDIYTEKYASEQCDNSCCI